MITFIFGPNTYEAARVARQHANNFAANTIERYDGIALTVQQLPDLFQGMSLFATERLVIIKEVSANKAVWEALPTWLDKISNEIQVIITETAPDKRTKTFKTLQKYATTVNVEQLNELQAVEWLKTEAKQRGGEIAAPAAKLLVEYVGTDQWQLAHELEKLLLVSDTSVNRIKATIEPTPQASAFALLDAAFARQPAEVRKLLRQCETLEDPYRLFGLLSHQIYQLAVVSSANGKTAEAIAKDIGAHPYPIKKLRQLARQLSKTEVAQAIEAVALLDDQLKRTVAEPWLLIERTLLKIAIK